MRAAVAIARCLAGSLFMLLAVWSGCRIAYRLQTRPRVQTPCAPVITLVARYPFYFSGNAGRRYVLPKPNPSERR